MLAGLAAMILSDVAARAQNLVPDVQTPGSIGSTGPTPAPAAAGAPPAAPAPSRGSVLSGRGRLAQPDRNAPVTFTANEVEYDRDRAVVTARGRVEAWQGDRILRADEFTYDRNTGVATVRGNVQVLEADGQVIFADSAVLSNNMRDAVIDGLRTLLAQNGRMTAAGARRTDGSILDLARVTYSSCNLCQEDPLAPPLWQLRARVATWDQTNRQVRYRDAAVEFAGIPLLYTPYLQHPDGSAPRQSGFLSPTFGTTRYLGGFLEMPYYWAIDESQDLRIAPTFSTRQAPNLGVEYRRRFNFGELQFDGSLGYNSGQDDRDDGRGFVGHVFSRGRFTIDENWRTGFDINRASSDTYLRTWRYDARRSLASSAFVEGFWGTEGYARLSGSAYQGLRSTDNLGAIPYVLPNTYADYVLHDGIGGTFTIDTWNFAVYRDQGTNTRRASTRATYELPFTDRVTGSVFTFRAQGDLAEYSYDKLNLTPNNAVGVPGTGTATQANVRLAMDWRLPLVRSAGEWGSQVIEPRVQIVTGPNTGSQVRVPNEDSLDFEFTDANLFELNRFVGRDRQEGGTRIDAALRGAWYFPNGGQLEAMGGRSFRLTGDGGPFYVGSGLENRDSDWVGRLRVSPVPWLTFLGRARLDGETGQRRFIDTSATVTRGSTSVTAGYLFATAAPYLTPVRDRDEVSLGVTQRIGQNWRVSASGRYDISIQRPVSIAASTAYEDECFIIEGRFVRNYAIDPTVDRVYQGSTLLMIRLTLKTIGDFGFRVI
ncbi:MAG TPA: LPS assembly protein LptD [Roseomonas sp.]